MRTILTILALTISTSAFAVHNPNHVPVPPKKAVELKNWKPPLEIQNKVVVPASPVKK